MEQLLLLSVGIFAGAMGCLIGIGGGFIIIPVLMFFYPELAPTQIAAISLFCVFTNALFGFVQSLSQKRIDLRTGIMFSLASFPGSVIGALLSFKIPASAFRIILGVIFFIASSLLFKNTFKNSYDDSSTKYNPNDFSKRNFSDSEGNVYTYSYNPTLGIILSTAIGITSSILGLGGGVFYFPLFVNLLKIPVKIATSTTQFILLLSSFAGTAIFIYYGALSHVSLMMTCLPAGIILGVLISGIFSKKIKPVFIVRLFSIILAFTGLRMFLSSLF